MLKKFLSAALIFTAAFTASADFNEPDFAFPQNVTDEAREVLYTTDNSLIRLKAVMELVKATTEVNPDSLKAMPAFVNGWAAKENDSTAGKALFMLYSAQVTQLADGKPVFSSDSILSGIEKWGKTPLSDYSAVLAIPSEKNAFFPYIRDFIFAKAISLFPEQAAMLVDRAVELSAEGSPEWARWICERQMKSEDQEALYEKYGSGTVGGYLLMRLCSQADWDKLRKIRMIESYLASNGENMFTDYFNKELNRLKAPTISVIAPEAVVPDRKFEVKCVYSFSSQVGFEILKVENIHKYNSQRKNIAVYSEKGNPEAYNDTVRFDIVLPEAGNYEIRIVSDDLKKDSYVPSCMVTATEWMPLGMIYEDSYAVAAADFSTGEPVQGVYASLTSDQKAFGATTGSNGVAFFTQPDKKNSSRGGFMTLSKGKDKVQFNQGLWNYGSRPGGKSLQGAVFTSRPLFHQGDTIEWAAVAVEKDFGKYSAKLVENTWLTAVLYDVNHQPVDTVKAVTDQFGRINGSFTAPSDRLAGMYTIVVYDGRNTVCSGSVTVSDFRLPVLDIEDLNVSRNDTAYVVSGRAVRFTGSPAPDADVDIVIRQMPVWWAFSKSDIGPVTARAATMADGSFKAYIPLFKDIPENGLNFICEATVTSLNAETASASTRFRVGKPFCIYASGYDSPLNVSVPVKFPVKAVGTDLKSARVELKWQLSGSETFSGICTTDSADVFLDWQEIPAGKYRFSVVPVDTVRCNSLEMGEIWIYNIARNEIPAELSLVVPDRIYNNVSGDFADIRFGVGSEAYLYSFGVRKDGKIDARVEKYSPGFHSARIALDGRRSQTVRIAVINDGRCYVEDIRVNRPVSDKSLKLKGECWRDNLVPGAREKWTLRLADADGNGSDGALVATLYNEAVNQLARNRQWPDLGNLLVTPQKAVRQYFAWPEFTQSQISFTAPRPYSAFALSSPQFLYLPEVMKMERMFYTRLTAKNASRMSAGAVSDLAVSEEMALDEDAGASQDATPESDDFQYRDSEVLQAFWMPMLRTDRNGYAVLEFTVPDALGDWCFNASAWTRDLRSASLNETLKASKPVMVEPSLPRFLRRGDSARIGATVTNNTDSAAVVTAVIEIFNPVDGEVLKKEMVRNNMDARSQTVVYIDADAGIGYETLGYRIKASDGYFTDGVRDIIPILESVTTAIDSDIFYLDSNQTTFTTIIPASSGNNGIVAVEYVQNPIWDAVKALPGLYEAEPRTAISAASSAYAALTALNLYNTCPEIKKVLDIWLENPADSSLVSDLVKDQDLKLATLAQTPFVGAANANTERMERLALTFNRKIISRTLDISVAKLESLQLPSGAFSWGSWVKEPSAWITLCVLKNIGRISDPESVGANARLRILVDRAFDYLDRNVRNISPYEYAGLYSCFPGRKPSTLEGQKAIDSTVQDILKTWKKHSASRKADDAVILNAFGNKASAREVISSLRQFARNSPQLGIVFPSVSDVDSYVSIISAFSAVEPESPLIDGMRKWLVLNTQTTDNLGAWNPTALISAILTTGTRWTADISTLSSDVSIGGRPVEITKIEAATGAFNFRLPPSASPRAITFTAPESTTGSYGSVTSVSTVPLSEVKPKSVDGLSVGRKFKAERDGRWVETDEFYVGEKVLVEITLNVGKEMQYVTFVDSRPAAFEPLNQMPGWIQAGRGIAYREITDTSCNLFFSSVEKAAFTLTYEVVATYAGRFVSGTATVQSQYAPEFTARSGASYITVLPAPNN